MGKLIDPKDFGLHPKTVIDNIGKGHFALAIERKSRIIMSDGRKILEKADKIKEVYPGAKISLRTTAPICSKTKALLKKHGIEII